MTRTPRPVLDHPWRRPGAARYGRSRLRGIWRPPVTVYEPAPGAVVAERDVAVTMRDGTVLRVNVFRPPGPGRFPVIMSAHPYGKDRLPTLKGSRSRFSFQYRMMHQAHPVRISTLTSWEAPDAAWWVQQGYAVVNADSRGGGSSQGVGCLLSDEEADDYFDLIEWAGGQAWSNGSVGLMGVSYLAMSQYKVAGLNPPSLKAICPWEGMTDSYRDLMRPGGTYEFGFARIWTAATKRVARLKIDMGNGQKNHPLRDAWWQELTPDLTRIKTPILVCASFSDNNLHSRGSFRAFEHVGSADRFAYTHRGGKWAVFYSDEANSAQRAFFDRYLHGATGQRPSTIRLEVRASREEIVEVRDESEWPLARTNWRALHLAAEGRLTDQPVPLAGQVSFRSRREAAAFTYDVLEDMELTGPMALRLWVEVEDADDVGLYVGVEKWRGSHYVGFEGSYGFGRDRVSTGWLKASLRELDVAASTAAQPVHTFLNPQPIPPGELVPLDIALGPSATLFRAGDSLRLVVSGRWLWPRNPLTGQFPAHYRRGPAGRCALHWGPERPAHLLVPHIAS